MPRVVCELPGDESAEYVMKAPKVLFVFPIAEMSIWDVARGYRAALAKRIGEENIRDYYLSKRAAYHKQALPEEQANNPRVVSQMATEGIVAEAVLFDVEYVLIISGLNFHALGLVLLRKMGIRTGVILTESPYEDEDQKEWASVYPEMDVFTNERVSAEQHGWTYLPAAYDPAVHHPLTLEDPYVHQVGSPLPTSCDVLLIGTGWAERQRLLEAVDWTGIHLRIYGLWTDLRDHPESPLFPYYHQGFVDNLCINHHYSQAQICLNFHRAHPTAESANPRTYELAACGAFQLCDERSEVMEIFGAAVPTFSTANDLAVQIRYYLSNPERRLLRVQQALDHVRQHTFDVRAERLVDVMMRNRRSVEPSQIAV